MTCFQHDATRESHDAADIHPTVYVAQYMEQQRASRRHKWKTVGPIFDCHGDRRSFHAMPAIDVPLPADVREEARAVFVASLRFSIAHPNHDDARKP